MTKESRTLLVVFITVLMDLIGFGIIIPISPFFAEALGANPAKITLLGASYSLMQFLCAPLWGKVSDRIGRRPVILSSIVIATIGYVLFAFAESFTALFIARLLSGFGTANFGAAQAVIADSTPPERRARGMGMLGAAFGLGFILGPALGGFLGSYGLRVPILAAAVLSGLNFFMALFLLPETLRPGAQPMGSRNPFKQIWAVGQERNVRRLLWIYLVYATAFSMMEQVLALFIQWAWVGTLPTSVTEVAGQASVMTAWALVVVGLTATVIQGGLIGKLVARFGEKPLLVVGCVLVALGLALIPVTGKLGSYPLFLLDMVLIAAGSGMGNPAVSSLLSRATRSTEQGHVMGVGQSLSALGRVLGPAAAGRLFEISTAIPFVLGGAMILVCAGMALRFRPVDRSEAVA